MRRLALMLALGVALAACSVAEDAAITTAAEGADFLAAEQPATTSAEAEEAAQGAAGAADGAIAVDIELARDRKVIRNAQLQLEADDTRAALDRIIALTEAYCRSSQYSSWPMLMKALHFRPRSGVSRSLFEQ